MLGKNEWQVRPVISRSCRGEGLALLHAQSYRMGHASRAAVAAALWCAAVCSVAASSGPGFSLQLSFLPVPHRVTYAPL